MIPLRDASRAPLRFPVVTVVLIAATVFRRGRPAPLTASDANTLAAKEINGSLEANARAFVLPLGWAKERTS
jgi:hypothetical protein